MGRQAAFAAPTQQWQGWASEEKQSRGSKVRRPKQVGEGRLGRVLQGRAGRLAALAQPEGPCQRREGGQ